MSDTFNVSFPVKSADIGAVIKALAAVNITLQFVPAAAPASLPAQSVQLQATAPAPSPAQSVQLQAAAPAPSGSQTVTTTSGPAASSTSSRGGSAVRCMGKTKKGDPCKAWACEDAKKSHVALCKVHYVDRVKTT